ncbi:MAG: hypothetical protein U0791_21525 [Gemmataceae bacterium]
MPALPTADWQASLDEMDIALGSALAALDRYQAGWERLLRDRAATEPRPAAGLELSLREWDARLQAAAELADSVERELHDRQDAVGRWQESIRLWQSR